MQMWIKKGEILNPTERGHDLHGAECMDHPPAHTVLDKLERGQQAVIEQMQTTYIHRED